MQNNYTLEHLKVVYKAGQANISFDDVVTILDWTESKSSNARGGGSAKIGRSKKTTGKRRTKGKLTDQIVSYLTSLKGEGAHVKQIAAAAKTKTQNVTAWFYTTGKKLIKSKMIKKTAPATFAFVGKDKE